MQVGAAELVERHFGLATQLSSRYLSKVPNTVDHDAVRGAAYEGLCIAANSFDPSRGVPFRAWAIRRVVGAMRDEMREQDHLSRRARARSNPDHKLYKKGFLKADPSPPKSLDEEFRSNGMALYEESLTLKDLLPDHNALDPSEGHSAIPREQLFGMMAQLPDREFRVVTLRYFGGLRLSDIASTMSLSETRISQIEGMALERLRGDVQ